MQFVDTGILCSHKRRPDPSLVQHCLSPLVPCICASQLSKLARQPDFQHHTPKIAEGKARCAVVKAAWTQYEPWSSSALWMCCCDDAFT